MLQWMRFLRGYLYVTLGGYAPERFLNLCRNQEIVIWNLCVCPQGYRFCVSLKTFRTLKPLLRKTGTRLKIQKKIGMPFLVFRYRKHTCFLVGIGGAAVLLFLLSGFIWSVQIHGNSYYTDEVLTRFLVRSGCVYAAPKSQMDCKKIQMLIRREFEDITWVSARISGTCLYVDVQERLPEKQTSEETEDAQDLVADYDGVVTSITTRSGTPVVQKGTAVKKGAVLVSGLVAREDDSGNVTGYKMVHADADVWIRTSLPYRNTFSEYEKQRIKTGKKKRSIVLEGRKRQIHLGFVPGKRGKWMLFASQYPSGMGVWVRLPMRLTWQVWESYIEQKVTLSEEEIQAKAQMYLNTYCKKLTEKGIQISGNDVMIKRNKNKSEILVEGTLDIRVKASGYRKAKSPDIGKGKKQEWN